MDKRASLVLFAAVCIALLVVTLAGCDWGKPKSHWPKVELTDIRLNGDMEIEVMDMGAYQELYFILHYKEILPEVDYRVVDKSNYTELSLHITASNPGPLLITKDHGLPFEKGKTYEAYLEYTIVADVADKPNPPSDETGQIAFTKMID